MSIKKISESELIEKIKLLESQHKLQKKQAREHNKLEKSLLKEELYQIQKRERLDKKRAEIFSKIEANSLSTAQLKYYKFREEILKLAKIKYAGEKALKVNLNQEVTS